DPGPVGEVHGLGEERLGLQGVVGDRRHEVVLVHERHVELPGAQGGGHVGGVDLGDHRHESGVGGGEPGERGRQQDAGGGGERADAERAVGAAADGGERGGGAFELFEHGLGVFDEQASGGGEGDGAAGTFEQRHTGFPFERAELLGDRRGGEG